MPPDQPTDAGKDRDRTTARRLLMDLDCYSWLGSDTTLREEDVETVAGVLAISRREGQAQEREACAELLQARVERCYELAAGSLSHEGKRAWMDEGAQLQGAVDAIRAREPREEPSR